MAQRRMFSPDIVDSDAFLDMPISSQLLYFHLSMRADDDGFVNPKKVMRLIGTGEDDLKVLLAKRFLLPFESGVVVIKHWLIHNMIRKDRYKETMYVEEKKLLQIKENGSYTELATNGLPNGNQMAPQVRLGKVSKDTETKVSTFEGKSITTDEEYEIVSDTPERKKTERKDKGALALREKLYTLFEKEFDVRPTPHVADYLRILDAMKRLNEKQILELVEDGIDSGKKKTVREALTAREVDIYLQNN